MVFFIRFIVFSLVGAIGTLGHFSLLYTLVEFYSFNPVLASGLGALLGLLINYLLNYFLTFKSHQSHVATFPKFALIAITGLSLNMGIMVFLTSAFFYLYAQLISTAIVLLWNFLINYFWTFRYAIPE